MSIKQFKTDIILGFFLVLMIIAVYGQIRSYGFILYDDPSYIIENVNVTKGVTIDSVKWAFTTRLHKHWHPVTWLSHMLDYQLFGLDPGWHHITSLLIHMVNSLLLFFLLRKITNAPIRSAAVAALFALHPLNVEAVTMIASRKDLLAALFLLLSLHAYIRYLGGKTLVKHLTILVLFLLGLMSKMIVVTLPIILILLDYWPLQRMKLNTKNLAQDSKTTFFTNNLVFEKGLLFAPAIIFGLIAMAARYSGDTALPNLLRMLPTKYHIAKGVVDYWTYIRKMFFPVDLATPYPWIHSPSILQIITAALILIAISLLIFQYHKSKPYLVFGWIWYIVCLLPVIGFYRPGPHTIADRYVYIPMIGLFIILVWGLFDIFKRLRITNFISTLIFGLLLFVLLTITWTQAGYWKNSITLLNHTIRVTQNNYTAYNNLGNVFELQGNIEKAGDSFKKALEINPHFHLAHTNLALTYIIQNRLDEAIIHINEALQIYPDSAQAYMLLGTVYKEKRNLKKAITYYKKAIQIHPNKPEIHFNLGDALALMGDFDGAINEFTAALKINWKLAAVHNALGYALLLKGDTSLGYYHLLTALEINPSYEKALQNIELAKELLGINI